MDASARSTGELTEAAFQAWLEGYKTAWENGDPDAVTALFAEDATYRETPFRPAMQGRGEIGDYWCAGARDAQRGVSFGYEVWAVSGAVGVCRWWARFQRVKDGERVELDGVFRCVFGESGEGVPLCRSLEEWWHRRSM